MNAEPPPSECDLAVVGAGIVGLAVARELTLRHHGARVAVIEGERRVGAHQTTHSSGVIHAGIYYEPGSLKARLCVRGSRELYEYCGERGIPVRRDGKLIVATEPEELPRLDELERRGRENGVPGLRRLAGAEIRELEPWASGLEALHSPATGVVDFGRVAAGLAGELAARGAVVSLGTPVSGIADRDGRAVVRHASGEMLARRAVVCAGAWSDRLAAASGAGDEPRIVPFRGAYLRLRPDRRELVRANIYPVPDPGLPFLGAHLTRGIDGEVLLGPSALLAPGRNAYRLWRIGPRDLAQTLAWPGTWRLARRHWRHGAAELRRAASRRAFVGELRRYLPALRPADVTAGPVGIRAQALGRDGRLLDDFAVSRTERTLFVRNAPSPAATSCLALARLIADELGPLD